MKTINDVKVYLANILGQETSKKFFTKVKILCKEAKTKFSIQHDNEKHFRNYLHKSSAELVKDTFQSVIMGDPSQFDSFDLYISEWMSKNGINKSSDIKSEIKKCISIVYHSIYKTCAIFGENNTIDNKRSYHINAVINGMNEIRNIQQKMNEIEEKLPNITKEESENYLGLHDQIEKILHGNV